LHCLRADLGPSHDDVEEMAQSSQESLVMTEDSISSMDIDLNALEKVSFCRMTLSYLAYVAFFKFFYYQLQGDNAVKHLV